MIRGTSPWRGAAWKVESGVPEEMPPQIPSQVRPIIDEYGGSSNLTSDKDFCDSGEKEYREDSAV